MALDRLEPATVRVFDGVTGAPLGRLPVDDFTYTCELNRAGNMTARISASKVAAGMGLRELLVPWRVNLAVVRGTRVLFAGVLRRAGVQAGAVTLDCGGGLAWFERRLVLNHLLADSWVDGEVQVDENNPLPQWHLALSGSLASIARDLVAESLKWGALPVTLPAREPGLNVRNYDCFDFAAVADRLRDLTELQDGIELRFTPRLLDNGSLNFLFEASPELVSSTWEWNTVAPGARCMVDSIDHDGEPMCSQVFAVGGKKDDVVLVSRVAAPAGDVPVLQAALTSHSSVSILETLQGYAGEMLERGKITQESFSLRVGAEYAVQAGDWANVRVRDWFLGETLLPLKIVSVAGGAGSDWLQIEARVRSA